MPYRPSWFRNDEVLVSFAETVGINKDGHELYKLDDTTGKRTNEIDDQVEEDVAALREGVLGPTTRRVPATEFTLGVPAYYDNREISALDDLLERQEYKGFESRSLGELIASGMLETRRGHGSPSADMRKNGDIPYIKVSDLRAGQVNINPSNLVSGVVARGFWRTDDSGLRPFDLITPTRASKNIGEFAVLMPGQEQVVLTKEFQVLRTSETARVDNFYLLWALSLKVVRKQWNRVVFMQTNREDVGERYLEVRIPWPTDPQAGIAVSQDFREYYEGIDLLRKRFVRALATSSDHHVFLGSVADAVATDEG